MDTRNRDKIGKGLGLNILYRVPRTLHQGHQLPCQRQHALHGIFSCHEVWKLIHEEDVQCNLQPVFTGTINLDMNDNGANFRIPFNLFCSCRKFALPMGIFFATQQLG